MSGYSRAPYHFVSLTLHNRYIVDAFYSGAKGAHVVNITNDSGDVWVLDCDVELNVSFKIAGVTYPIHPLDVTQAATDDNGKTYCFGTVRETSLHNFVC